MTDNDIVQFAAGKLGVEIAKPAGYAKGWHVKGKDGWVFEVFDPLADWGLLRQGLEALVEQGATFDIDQNDHMLSIWPKNSPDRSNTKTLGYVFDIPKTFWIVWYELEQPQHGSD